MTSSYASSSLIIATYNWKEALALVLATVRVQSVLPGEVLVADDGSRDDTRELIAREAAVFPVPLRHLLAGGRRLPEEPHPERGDGARERRVPDRRRRRHAAASGVRALAPALRAPRVVHPGEPDDARRTGHGSHARGRRARRGPALAGRAQPHQRHSRALAFEVGARRPGADPPHARLQHLVLARRTSCA